MNNYKPTPSMRKNQAATLSESDLSYELLDDEWVDLYKGKIAFFSYSLKPLRSDNVITRLRVYTKLHIPFKIIEKHVRRQIKGARVSECFPYGFTHTFEVISPKPLTFHEFGYKIIDAVCDYL